MFAILNKDEILRDGVITTETHGRFYNCNGVWCPSVTTVTKLLDNKVYSNTDNYARNRGTAMHTMLEEYCLLKHIENSKQRVLKSIENSRTRPEIFKEGITDREFEAGRKLFIKFWEKYKLNDLHNVIQTEFQIKHTFTRNGKKYGYAGRMDCLAIIGGALKMIDFKSSGMSKTKDQIQNYYLQLPAYIIPYQLQNNNNCDGEIWIASDRSDDLQIFSLLEHEIQENYIKFENLVIEYYNINKDIIEFINKNLQ
jgi:hypothetical protein